MRIRSKEYTVDELIDEPVVGLALEDDGIDRRSLALLIDAMPRQAGHSAMPIPAPFFG